MSERLPSQSILRELFDYDPLTGVLTFKVRESHWFRPGKYGREHMAASWNTQWAGKAALACVANNGYLHGAVLGTGCLAHRVIWKWLYGTEPNKIDHDDGRRQNNKQTNLIASDSRSNAKNGAIRRNNATGHTGVYRSHPRQNLPFRATIKGENKSIHLGYFGDIESAIQARREAETRLGYHPNHGKRPPWNLHMESET